MNSVENKIKEAYVNEMNGFCTENCNVTLDSVMAKATKATTEQANIEPKANQRKQSRVGRRSRRIVLRLVACIALLSTLTVGALAATGELDLAKIFRDKFEDEVTADIIEEGHKQDLRFVMEDEQFQVTLQALTGDVEVPVLLFDVYVKDPAIDMTRGSMKLYAYTLGAEEYDTNLDTYAPSSGYATQDEEDPALYHVRLVGAPAWLAREMPCVVDVCQIIFTYGDEEVWHDVNFEYRFIPSLSAFSDIEGAALEEKFDTAEGEMEVRYTNYSRYNTELGFYFNNFVEEDAAITYWNSFVYDDIAGYEGDYSHLTLTVDGVSYEPVPDCSYPLMIEDSGRRHALLLFPAIDYEEAQSVVLHYGEQEIVLK